VKFSELEVTASQRNQGTKVPAGHFESSQTVAKYVVMCSFFYKSINKNLFKPLMGIQRPLVVQINRKKLIALILGTLAINV